MNKVAVIRLREILLSPISARKDLKSYTEIFLKTQRAIQLFCKNRPIDKLYAPKEVIYAVPLILSGEREEK